MGVSLIDPPTGPRVSLSAVEDIPLSSAPAVISREGAQRRIIVSANTTGAASLTSIAQEVQHRIAERVHLPTGYYVVFGGEDEAESQAVRQMLFLVVATVIGIALFFFLAFRSLRD